MTDEENRGGALHDVHHDCFVLLNGTSGFFFVFFVLFFFFLHMVESSRLNRLEVSL